MAGPGFGQGFEPLFLAVPNVTYVDPLLENIIPRRIISGSYSAGEGLSIPLELSRFELPNFTPAIFLCLDCIYLRDHMSAAPGDDMILEFDALYARERRCI